MTVSKAASDLTEPQKRGGRNSPREVTLASHRPGPPRGVPPCCCGVLFWRRAGKDCVEKKWALQSQKPVVGDVPGGPVVKTALPIWGAWVRSLIGDLRSYMLCGTTKIMKK